MIDTEPTSYTPAFLNLSETRRLAVCGLAELPAYLEGSVSHVISLIDPRLSFDRLPGIVHLLLRLHDIDQNLPGHNAPTSVDAEAVLAFVGGLVDRSDGFSLVIHCHAGISRSSAAALAAMLVLDDRLDPQAALAALALHRPQMWPNALLTGHFDRTLGLEGSLIDAVATYRREAFDADLAKY